MPYLISLDSGSGVIGFSIFSTIFGLVQILNGYFVKCLVSHFADSSCSVDSDWSDEELEELEKILGDIQERSDAAETAAEAEGGESPLERRARAVERWNKVRKSLLVVSPTG